MDEPFIINLADAPASSHSRRATMISLEPADASWPDTGCPAGVDHVFVGAGDGPCAVLMIGSRREDAARYPVNAVAARYDASVSTPTDDPDEAYADWRQEPRRPAPNPWPLGSP